MNFKFHLNTEALGFQKALVLQQLNLFKELEGQVLIDVFLEYNF
jgi:hypothetical protein